MSAGDPILPFRDRSVVSRLMAFLVGIAYLAVPYYVDDPWLFIRVLGFVAPLVAIIWYADALSDPTSTVLGWVASSYRPPEGLVVLVAWLVLLSPVWVVALSWVFARTTEAVR